MPNGQRDLAGKACDTAFQQCVIGATSALMTNLTLAAGNAEQVSECRASTRRR